MTGLQIKSHNSVFIFSYFPCYTLTYKENFHQRESIKRAKITDLKQEKSKCEARETQWLQFFLAVEWIRLNGKSSVLNKADQSSVTQVPLKRLYKLHLTLILSAQELDSDRPF